MLSISHIPNLYNKIKINFLEKTKINHKNICQNLNINLNDFADNNLGKHIAFGTKIRVNSIANAKCKLSDVVSKKFSATGYFPPDKKIPDGFRFFSTLPTSKIIPKQIDSKGRLYDKKFEQITVIDTKKDKDLVDIINDYKKQIPIWKKECENDILNKYWPWEAQLISKTRKYIRQYNKNLSFKEQYKLVELDLAQKETYLGEIVKNGLAFCRHNAFLNKILLETQNVHVGVQTGFLANPQNPINTPISGHCWNIKLENYDKITDIIDVSQPIISNEYYFDNYFNRLYNKKFPSYLDDLKQLKPGKSILIGINDKNEVGTNLTDKTIKPILKLKWNENDDFVLTRMDQNTQISDPIENTKFGNKKIIDRNTIFYLYSKNALRQCNIDPQKIRRTFGIELQRAEFKTNFANKNFSPYQLYSSKELTEANEALDSSSILIYRNPHFRQNWNKHISE